MTSKDLAHNEEAGSIVPAQDLKGLLESMASDLETPLSSSKNDRPTPLYNESKKSLHNESKTIYVLLDCSGSMAGGEKLTQAKSGIVDFAMGSWKKGYEVGLISFTSSAKLILRAADDLDNFRRALSKLRPSGSTNMADALDLAHEHLGKEGNRQILLTTDGMPDNQEATLKAAKRVKDSGATILTIGTDDADLAFLKLLASTPERAAKVKQDVFLEGIKDMTRLLPP